MKEVLCTRLSRKSMPAGIAEFRRLFKQLTSIRDKSPAGKAARVKTCIPHTKEFAFSRFGASCIPPWDGLPSTEAPPCGRARHLDRLSVLNPRAYGRHFQVPECKQHVSVRTATIRGEAGQPCLGCNCGPSDLGNPISFSKAARRMSRVVIGERIGMAKTGIRVHTATGRSGKWPTALRGLIG